MVTYGLFAFILGKGEMQVNVVGSLPPAPLSVLGYTPSPIIIELENGTDSPRIMEVENGSIWKGQLLLEIHLFFHWTMIIGRKGGQ